VGALNGLLWATGVAWARPAAVYWEEGRLPDVLVVELAAPAVERRARWGLPPELRHLEPLLDGARVRPVAPALTRFVRIHHPDAEVIGTLLLEDPRVLDAWLAPAPVPPPEDLPPETADFRALQTWLDAFPGLGFDEASRWPGGRGENVTIVDIEYGWDPTHEDLGTSPAEVAWGQDSGSYRFHGNSVLGQLVGGDNGYGVVGAVPDAQVLMVSPFDADGAYDVAAAVAGAAAMLQPGDVILIEQQAWSNEGYCPVSVDRAVRAAIEAAVDAGIVVVEPGGNGGQDLDAPAWEGRFDRENDPGSILVGGGASPESGWEPRAWYPGGSSYGSRVDVQGWYDGIVTATSDDYGPALADLWYPDQDPRQAYTRSFGGTSGASPMIAAMAAIAQSVAIELTGEPWDPRELRAALVATGTPQAGEELIGPQPDLQRLLRTYFLP
jgi:hypothetical protein